MDQNGAKVHQFSSIFPIAPVDLKKARSVQDTGDGMPVRSPHLALKWQAAGKGGWNALEGMKVEIDAESASATHAASLAQRDRFCFSDFLCQDVGASGGNCSVALRWLSAPRDLCMTVAGFL